MRKPSNPDIDPAAYVRRLLVLIERARKLRRDLEVGGVMDELDVWTGGDPGDHIGQAIDQLFTMVGTYAGATGVRLAVVASNGGAP